MEGVVCAVCVGTGAGTSIPPEEELFHQTRDFAWVGEYAEGVTFYFYGYFAVGSWVWMGVAVFGGVF